MEKIVMKNVFYDRPQNEPKEQPKKYATIDHEDEAIILSNLLDDVYVHDFSYMMSDDPKVYTRGKRHQDQILESIDVLIVELRVDAVGLCRQLLSSRPEQYTDGLTHRTIKGWFSQYM